MQSTSRPRLAVAAFLAVLAVAPFAGAVTLAEALDAYRSNRVAEAEAMLGELAADDAAADRAAALRELGRIDWLVRGETDAAAAALAAAPDGESRCAALLLALRVYREAGAPQTALDEAARGRGECAPAAAENMRVAIARAQLAASRPAAAAAELGAVSPAARRSPSVAAANLSLALAQADAAAALAAWRDYFWLDAADAPQAMGAYAGRVEAILAAGLAANAAETDRIALVEMLIRAGFADDARALAGADAENWTRAHAYFAFRDAVRAATLRANREMAAGGRAEWYRDSVMSAVQQLMRDAALSVELSDDPRVALSRTMTALAEAYGLFGTLGETSGYPSLHAGHLVQDERMAVAQYGRSGELRFVVIDNMLSNGFESWLWDGWAEAGGWSGGGGMIVQVRSAYTHGPLNALRRARPGPDRDRFVAEIERAEEGERAALGRGGVASLPATSDRLELQAIDQIAARTDGDDGAFLAEHWRATIDYSITLHEGRHALDKASGDFSSAELEFRAKLSQIALSEYPRLGLANVTGQTLSDTPHGQANRRLLEGYRTWMRAHRREITGFDRNAPTLSQLHLLSDEQIVAAAQSLDPWAR